MELTNETLQQIVVIQGKSFSEAARLTGKTVGQVSVLAKKLGITSKHTVVPTVVKLPITEIYKKYVDGVSLDALHKEYKCPVARIKRGLLRNYPGLMIRSMDEVKRPAQLNDVNYLIKCTENNISFRQIARDLDVGKDTVIAAYRRFGIIPPKVELEQMSCELSISRIAGKFSVSKDVVLQWMRDYSINVFEATKIKSEIMNNDPYYGDWRILFESPEKCSEWLLQYGFQGVKYPLSILEIGVRKLYVAPSERLNANIPNTQILSLIRHFSQYYYRSHHTGYNPISAAWEVGNQVVLKLAVKALWDSQKDCNIYGLVSHIGRYFKDFAPISVFKPWVASYVYDRLLPKGGTVIDPCMGWGGRWLGCVGKHNMKYVGYDLNKNSVEAHEALYKFVSNNVESNFNQADSVTADFVDGDLLFTSPPYDSTEFYYGIDSNITKTEPILRNIFVKFKGDVVALNVPLRQKVLCSQIGLQSGWRLSEELQMKTTSFMGREKTYEPILVFKQ